MEQSAVRNDIIRQLQKEVISLQGMRKSSGDTRLHTGLGPIELAFPGRRFPTGVIHELISPAAEQAATTNGFIAGIAGRLMQQDGTCLWISTSRSIFPPALRTFGIDPDRIIFIDLQRPKEVLWAMEEALKCASLSAVVGELKELSFTESRRLQLAVEQSLVTGFIHRRQPRAENTVACVSRWKISPLPGETGDGLPGVGFPRWQVDLVKVRNGRPGTWVVEWTEKGFRHITRPLIVPEIEIRKTG
jgi:protein ImuA